MQYTGFNSNISGLMNFVNQSINHALTEKYPERTRKSLSARRESDSDSRLLFLNSLWMGHTSWDPRLAVPFCPRFLWSKRSLFSSDQVLWCISPSLDTSSGVSTYYYFSSREVSLREESSHYISRSLKTVTGLATDGLTGFRAFYCRGPISSSRRCLGS